MIRILKVRRWHADCKVEYVMSRPWWRRAFGRIRENHYVEEASENMQIDVDAGLDNVRLWRLPRGTPRRR